MNIFLCYADVNTPLIFLTFHNPPHTHLQRSFKQINRPTFPTSQENKMRYMKAAKLQHTPMRKMECRKGQTSLNSFWLAGWLATD